MASRIAAVRFCLQKWQTTPRCGESWSQVVVKVTGLPIQKETEIEEWWKLGLVVSILITCPQTCDQEPLQGGLLAQLRTFWLTCCQCDDRDRTQLTLQNDTPSEQVMKGVTSGFLSYKYLTYR